MKPRDDLGERRATGEVWRIRQWEKFQHYTGKRTAKGGPPPWIKHYRSLLDDLEFRALTPAARDLLRDLWLIAAERNGEVPADPERIAWRLRVASNVLAPLLRELLTTGHIEGSDAMLAACYQDASNTALQSREEKKREEEKGEARAGARDVTATSEYERLMRRIPAAYSPAVAGALRQAKDPAAVYASIEALMSGLHGSYSPEIVGRALTDWQASGEPFKARTLDVFCGDLKRRLAGGASDALSDAERMAQAQLRLEKESAA